MTEDPKPGDNRMEATMGEAKRRQDEVDKLGGDWFFVLLGGRTFVGRRPRARTMTAAGVEITGYLDGCLHDAMLIDGQFVEMQRGPVKSLAVQYHAQPLVCLRSLPPMPLEGADWIVALESLSERDRAGLMRAWTAATDLSQKIRAAEAGLVTADRMPEAGR